MPGLSIWIKKQSSPEDSRKFAEAVQGMCHDDGYISKIAYARNGIHIGYAGYPDYPVACYNSDDLFILVEGIIYSIPETDTASTLTSLAESAFSSVNPENQIKSFIQSADGDFVVVIVDRKTNEIIVFSDRLGRLPLFRYADEHQFILTRECKVVNHLRGQFKFDRFGWGSYFWLGYVIGDRTLFQDIYRAPVALFTHIRPDQAPQDIDLSSLVTWDFSVKNTNLTSVDKTADLLLDQFFEACRLRATCKSNPKNIVALSGGQDSRAVAAALTYLQIPFETATFIDINRRFERDSQLAAQVAKTLQAPWTLFELPEDGLENWKRLIQALDGMHSIEFAEYLPFVDAIAEKWGRDTVYFSGDIGDVFYYLISGDNNPSRKSVLKLITNRYSRSDSDVAESLFGLQKGSLIGEIDTWLDNYPEKNNAQKFVHFHFLNRERNWISGNEDRLKLGLWQTTPFFANPFFETAMSVPDEYKKDYRLYRLFQTKLNPATAAIGDARYTFSSKSLQQRIVLAAIRTTKQVKPLYELLRFLFKGSRKPFVLPEQASTYFIELQTSSSKLFELLDRDLLEIELRRMQRRTFYNFFTLALLYDHWSEFNQSSVE